MKLLRSGGPAGVRHLVPGRWGIVSLDVANLGDAPAEMTGRVFFPADAYRQFGRQLWAPARSVRRSWFPVQVPEGLSMDRSSTEISGMMLAGEASGSAHQGSRTGERFQTGLVPVYHGAQLTGILDESGDGLARSAIVAMRQARGLDLQVAGLDGQTLAPIVQVLDGLDRLVIADDQILGDAATLSSVQQWILRGGVAWVMLDRTDDEVLAAILGEESQCQVVDRVDRMEIRFLGVGLGGKVQEFDARTLDEPVAMVRVLTANVDVTHSIDGWPVAFWQTMGRGKVLVTTLGSRGWTRRRNDGDPIEKRASQRIEWLATEPLERLAYEFYQPVPTMQLPQEAASQYVRSRVGYQVASRSVIMGTSGLFVATLILASVLLASRGKLEHIGWLGPAMAIAAACVLAGVGRAARSKVPPTAASLQLVDVGQENYETYGAGQLAIYQPEAGTVDVSGAGASLNVDSLGLAGATRALIWQDLDRWQLDGLQLSGGVHEVGLATTLHVEQPVRAVVRFGSQGLTGRIEAEPFQNLGDAVIVASRVPALAVALEEDGQIAAPPGNTLSQGEFLASGVLSDEQRRRQTVYRSLEFASRVEGTMSPSEAALLIWADPRETNLNLPTETRQIGGTLLRVPLTFEKPEGGSRVVISSTFLPFESVPGPGRIGAAPTYSNQDGKWISPLTEPARTVLKFTMPASVAGARIERAVLRIAIRASGRVLTIAAIDGEEFVPLAERLGPLGTIDIELSDTEKLQPDDHGEFLLSLQVGEPEEKTPGTIDAQGWGIEDVRLEIEAAVPNETSPAEAMLPDASLKITTPTTTSTAAPSLGKRTR